MLENLVRELREGEITREKTLKVKQSIADLNIQVDAQKEALRTDENTIADFTRFVANQQKEAKKPQNTEKSKKIKKQKIQKRKISFKDLTKASLETPASHALFKLEKGSPVLIGKNRRQGTLIEEGKQGTWLVQIGSLKITIKTTELFPDWNKITNIKNTLEVSPTGESLNSTASVDYILEQDTTTQNDKPKFELRLLGMHYDEALKTLQKQLDLCTMHNFRKFSIIHGKGNGVLQQAVQDYLSHYPGVKDFYYARPEHGGTGKTFVELED
jgi:DNA mismatch repair protein MutS2